jgi:hypothetical protein
MNEERDRNLYLNDPSFRAWADMVENALENGVIDLDRMTAATNVGISHFALHHMRHFHMRLDCIDPPLEIKTVRYNREYETDPLLRDITAGTATCTHIAQSLGINHQQVSRIASKYHIKAAGVAVYFIPEKGRSEARSFDLEGWKKLRQKAIEEGLVPQGEYHEPPPGIMINLVARQDGCDHPPNFVVISPKHAGGFCLKCGKEWKVDKKAK